MERTEMTLCVHPLSLIRLVVSAFIVFGHEVLKEGNLFPVEARIASDDPARVDLLVSGCPVRCSLSRGGNFGNLRISARVHGHC